MRRLLAVAATLVLVAASCGDDDTGAEGESGRLSVVASFYPIAEAARLVGGDLVEVTNLTPAGTEPHDLELTPGQVDRLEDADVVLYLGQGFQPAVEDVARRRGGSSIDLLEAVDLEQGAAGFDDHAAEDGHAAEDDHAAEDGHAAEDDHADDTARTGEEGGASGEEHAEGELDPHFWLDPTRFADAVDRIGKALTDAAPEHADAFARNAQRYRDELMALDEEFQGVLARCERATIVTSHAAFHYLAERYNLKQLPIAGLSPESEPTPQRLAELADLIRKENVTTVFYETLVAPDVAETLAREAGVDTAVLNPLEGLAQEEIDAGKDYAAVMRDNLAALTRALACT